MRFLYSKPALLIDDILIVADLHIGIESELFEKGIRIAGMREKILDELVELVRETNAKRIIILGDAKHGLLNIDYEVADFFHQLLRHAAVEIVKGNHDGNLENVAGVKVHPAEGIVIATKGRGEDGQVRKIKYGLCHGHAWPAEELMKADYLLIAHNHPRIEIVDKGGYRHVENVWAVGGIDAGEAGKRYAGLDLNWGLQIVVIPPFNKLLSGARLNYDWMGGNEGIGPLLKNKLFKFESAIAYRLDGTCLGRIGDLKALRGAGDGLKKTRQGKAGELRFVRKTGAAR